MVTNLALLCKHRLAVCQLSRRSQDARLCIVCSLLQCCPLRLCLPQGLPAGRWTFRNCKFQYSICCCLVSPVCLVISCLTTRAAVSRGASADTLQVNIRGPPGATAAITNVVAERCVSCPLCHPATVHSQWSVWPFQVSAGAPQNC
jgi:hypothetical protein